jgi:hypothetical protein
MPILWAPAYDEVNDISVSLSSFIIREDYIIVFKITAVLINSFDIRSASWLMA